LCRKVSFHGKVWSPKRKCSSLALVRSLGNQQEGPHIVQVRHLCPICHVSVSCNTVKSCSVGGNGFGCSPAFGSARRRLFLLLCGKLKIYLSVCAKFFIYFLGLRWKRQKKPEKDAVSGATQTQEIT